MNKQIITVIIVLTLIFQTLVCSFAINELLCCCIYILSIVCRKRNDSFSIYDVFLVTLFLFCYDVIFGDLFGIYDLHYFDHFGQVHTFSNIELITSFKALSFFQAGIALCWLHNTEKTVPMKQRVLFTDGAKKLSLIMFYVMFIPAFISKIFIVYSSIIYGYVESIQFGELINSNIFVYLGSSLFEVTSAFCLYLASDKKEFRRLAILYAMPNFLLLFTGQRGPAIVTLLAVLWLYNKYIEKIKIKYILIFGATCVIFMPLIGHWRGDSEYAYNGILDWVSHFFLSQGMSFNVIPFTVGYLDAFTNKVPFLFGYLTDLINPTQAYTLDSITNGNYLAYHLSYHVYGNVFFLGHTMGTSLIAELYELVGGHYYLILPLSYLIMKLTIFFSNNLYKNPILFVIGIKYIMCFIYSPRDSIGKVLSFTIVYTIIFAFFMYTFFSVRKKIH